MQRRSLAEGWELFSDLCKEFNKDTSNASKKLKYIPDTSKEKLGNTWAVKRDAFISAMRIERGK